MSQISKLYPIKFIPILKEKVWGGSKLSQLFNKNGEGKIGESWEVSAVNEDVSIVDNGSLKGNNLNQLIEVYQHRLVGNKVYRTFGNKFPLLFKFIDAKEDLSVQLHPNDELAKKRHNSFGKTEMWYILDAEVKGKLVLGFNKKMNKSTYKKHLSENTLSEILHSEKVEKGDSFIIESGIVHAIGAGVVLAEIQQTSDVTYRIFDYNRPDIDGKLRELHTNLAIDAIDFNNSSTRLNYVDKENFPVQLFKNVFFHTNKIVLSQEITRDLSSIDSFVVYMCVEGEGIIEMNGFSETIVRGETLLVPAETIELIIKSTSAILLEVYIP